ncbi:MAG: FeoB-associated Cys-rich membrane protein [Cytophagaceae bacterium]|nr:FeoB-associated Cys-rich membrane protein [Cytophagaceae bacterium]
MIQQILIGLLFTAALGYLGYLFYKKFNKKSDTACDEGCGCSSIELEKIAAEIKKKSEEQAYKANS